MSDTANSYAPESRSGDSPSYGKGTRVAFRMPGQPKRITTGRVTAQGRDRDGAYVVLDTLSDEHWPERSTFTIYEDNIIGTRGTKKPQGNRRRRRRQGRDSGGNASPAVATSDAANMTD